MAPLAPPGYAYALPPLGNFLRTPLPAAQHFAYCQDLGTLVLLVERLVLRHYNQLQNPVTILPETTCETPSFNLSFALNVTFSIYCTLILSIPIDLCHLVFSFMRLQNI